MSGSEHALTRGQAMKVAAIARALRKTGGTAIARNLVIDGILVKSAAADFRYRYLRDQLARPVIEALEQLPGWRWEPKKSRHETYAACLREYVRAHGWEEVSESLVIDGNHVGAWFYAARRRYQDAPASMTPRLRALLKTIPGWEGLPRHLSSAGRLTRDKYLARRRDAAVARHIETLRRWHEVHPGVPVTARTRFEGSFLGKVIEFLRSARSQLRPASLSAIGAIPEWSWSRVDDSRRANLDRLRKLARQHGQLPGLTAVARIDGHCIGSWLSTCWRQREAGTIDPALERQLERIPGWIWHRSREGQHRYKLKLLQKYLESRDLEDLSSRPTFRGVNLQNWVTAIRAKFTRLCNLPDWLELEMEKIPGWSWTPRADRQRLRRLTAEEERHDRRERSSRPRAGG